MATEVKFERHHNEERAFEVRHHQLLVEDAMAMQVTDLLKESEESTADRIAISKADIILIYAIYQGGIIEFFNLYKAYVDESIKRGWKACDKPHWFLKRSID